MRKALWLLSVALVVCAVVYAADWPSTAGNPQRDGWSRGETKLSKESLANKQVQLLYKYKFDNQARGLDALTAPADLSNIIGYKGFKELLFIGGSSDVVYAIDSDMGKAYFTTKFDPMDKAAAGGATALCPGGLTANIAFAGSSAGGRGFGAPPPAPAGRAGAAGAAPGGAAAVAPGAQPGAPAGAAQGGAAAPG